MDLLNIIRHAGPAGWITLAVLGFLSVVSWGIMMHKYQVVSVARSRSRTFLETFWKSRNLENLYESTRELPPSPVSRVFQTAYVELVKLSAGATGGEKNSPVLKLDSLDNVERSLRRSATTEVSKLEGSLSFLATTGATAPFIGLFGTVMGIMRSFHQIGLSGSANLADVAPGISEALLATAVGLAAAIPAVVGFNTFQTSIRSLSTELENFSADFLNIVKRHFFH